jgi:hypothetical protein
VVGRCYDQDILGFRPKHLLRGVFWKRKELSLNLNLFKWSWVRIGVSRLKITLKLLFLDFH